MSDAPSTLQRTEYGTRYGVSYGITYGTRYEDPSHAPGGELPASPVTITSLNPTTTTTTAPDHYLDITGSGPGEWYGEVVAHIDGVALETAPMDETTIQTIIRSGSLAAGVHQVTLVLPGFGPSNALPLTVT